MLPSPRARLLRRSPVSEKMSNGARRGRNDKGGGGGRISRRRPPSVPNSEAKSSRSRASDASPGKGHRRSSSSRSRKEEELVVGGGDTDAAGMGKSHYRRNSGRHKERDDATSRRFKEDRSRSDGHRSRRDVGESGRGQRSRRDVGDDRGFEESKVALSNGTAVASAGNGSSLSSKRHVSKRELKRSSRHVDEMKVNEATSATKILNGATKVHRNGRKNIVKEDGEVKSGESSATEGMWVKRPPRRTGSSQELVPPTW